MIFLANNHWPDVPIPEGSTVYKDRVIYTFGHIYSDTQQRKVLNRKSIGTPCEDGKMMSPNQTYMKHFSDAYQSYTGMLPLSDHVSIGLYAATSAIVTKTGLRSCLEKVFGKKRTNSILDYAMYAISCHSNVSEHYSAKMELIHVFSDRIYKDSYWSSFFDKKIQRKEIERFKELWVLQCVEKGVTIGYSSWDGSNNDCDSKGVEEANQGKAKSGTSGNIYGYMYCVAQDGTPITYSVHDGSTPDNVAIKKMIQSLKNVGITIPGAIIDRGFDDLKCLKELLTIVDDYVVKLKENTIGFKNAAKEKGEEVRKFKSSLRIPNERLFGDTIKSVLFNKSDSEDWVHIFYDFQNGGERAFALLDEIDGAIEDIKKKTRDYIEYEKKWEEEKVSSKQKEEKEKKPFSVSVPAKLKGYIEIKGTKPGDIEIIRNDEKINREVWGKGLYAVGTHSEMSAEKANGLYKLRDNIEKLFDIIKTLLGFDRIRTESAESMESRMFIVFIATIIYTELANASKAVAKEKRSTNPKYDTTATIDQLISVAMILLSNGTYGLQYKSMPRIQQIFKKLNAEKDILETVVEDYNLDLQKRKKKQKKESKEKADSSKDTDNKAKETSNTKEDNLPKRPRGRPPKNKDKTEEKPKRPRGRPPKPRDPLDEQKPKRPRGRPPKPKSLEPEKPKRPRGRPRKHNS